MKFKIWLLYTKTQKHVLKIYRLPFLTWIRNTLLFNVLCVFLMILIVLSIIFRFAPDTAHVVYKSNVENLSTSNQRILAGNTSINGTISKLCIFKETKSSSLVITNSSGYFIYDDIRYDSSYEIHFEEQRKLQDINYNDSFPTVIFIESAENESFSTAAHFFQKYPIENFQKFSISGREARIGFFSRMNISASEALTLSIPFADSGSAYIRKSGESDIPIVGKITIASDSNYNQFSYINEEIDTATVKFTSQAKGTSARSAEIRVSNIKEFTYRADGTLLFSYSPTPVQYDLNNQIVSLHSKNQLSAHIQVHYDENDVFSIETSINAIVSEASISGVSLFPNFFSWYRENVYLVPITLISTIFGGVALTSKKVEK